MAMDMADAIKKAKEAADPRNFTQSVDLIVNLKNVELDNPENRFAEDITLPYQASEDTTVAVIGDTLVKEADNADITLTGDELEELFDDQDEAKDLAEEVDFFIAEAPLMPDIGQHLGPILGPRNKMPKPMPPGSDPTDRIEELRKTVSVKVREQPSVKSKVGHEAMEEKELASNADAILNLITDNMPRGEHNIKDIYVKLTMGPVVAVK
ncbi:MAG: 50S ribosomal protein L1 [Candidatus Nanohaloarchaea archaeon]|nr:50S ribosomal protein L1 [Candidatus Nanohaloarchaea archaeon]